MPKGSRTKKIRRRLHRRRDSARLRNIHTPPPVSNVTRSARPGPREPLIPHEVMMRKAELLGGGTVVWCDIRTREAMINGDPSKVVDALSLCFHRRLINGAQRFAGVEFTRLHRSAFGKPQPKVSAYREMVAEHIDAEAAPSRVLTDEEREMKLEWDYADYVACMDLLTKTGRYPVHAVWQVCIIGEMVPDAYLDSLRRGLNALSESIRWSRFREYD